MIDFEEIDDYGDIYRGEFEDCEGRKCALEDFEFKGKPSVKLTVEVDGKEATMHFTQEDVQNLVPALRVFASTGSLPTSPRDMYEVFAFEEDVASLLESLGRIQSEINRLTMAYDATNTQDGPWITEAVDRVKLKETHDQLRELLSAAHGERRRTFSLLGKALNAPRELDV